VQNGNKWVHYESIWALNTSQNDDRFVSLLRQITESETDSDLRRAAHAILYHRDQEYRAAHIARIRAEQTASAA
jgi:hypothetical protein